MENKKPYSEVIASFLRTTNEPLEKDYIFSSVDEIRSWAKENANILHSGLLKVMVGSDNVITFYTFVPGSEFGECALSRLLSTSDIDNLKKDIESSGTINDEFKNDVLSKIEELNKRIQAIWGVADEATLPESMNSIKKIIDTITSFIKFVNSLDIKNTDKALAGTSDENVVSYLQTLRYNSITALSNVFDKFFNQVDESDNSINTWSELKKFLKGFKDTDILKDYIHEHIGHILQFVDTDTVDMEKLELRNSTEVRANVRIDPSTENQISVRKDGLFMNVSIVQNGSILEFYVNGNLKKIINLAEYAFQFKDVYYDPNSESIVIVVKTLNGEQTIRIPMSVALREWEIANSDDSPVVLSMTSAIGQGKDKLSANVKISSKVNNILSIEDGALCVNGIASLIKYKDNTVAHTLDKLSEKVQLNKDNIDSAVNTVNTLKQDVSTLNQTVSSNYKEIKHLIDDESESRKNDVTSINSRIDSLVDGTNKNLESMKKYFDDKIGNLDSKLSSDIQDARHYVDDAKSELEVSISNTSRDLSDKIDGVSRSFDEQIRTTSTNVAHLEAKFNSFKGAVDVYMKNNDIEIASIKSDIESLKVQITDGFSDISKEIESLKALINENHKWVEIS